MPYFVHAFLPITAKIADHSPSISYLVQSLPSKVTFRSGRFRTQLGEILLSPTEGGSFLDIDHLKFPRTGQN